MSEGEALSGGFIRESSSTGASHHGVEPRNLSVAQESRLIHFVDQKLLSVSRMYKNRAVEDGENAVASKALDQLIAEMLVICQVLSLVPRTSSAIAVAYLLVLMDMTAEYIRVFEPSPATTFDLLTQLDNLFAGLITSGQVSLTEQTRLSALIGRVREATYTKYKDKEQYEVSCSGVLERSLSLI